MPVIQHKITIKRPVFDVYRMVTNFDEIQQWQPDTVAVSVTSGDPLRAGSMISIRRKFMGRTIFINVDVIDLQRNKKLELRGVHGTFQYSRTIEFATAAMETNITDRINIRTPLLFFWYGPFLGSALRSQTAREWQNLKNLLESHSGVTAPPSR